MSDYVTILLLISILIWPLSFVVALVVNLTKVPKMVRKMYPGKDAVLEFAEQELMKDIEEETVTETQSADVLSKGINDISGAEFERYCAELLKQNGYTNVHVTPASGDQGIDILAEKDSMTWGFQCKHYSQTVGNAAVREAFAGKAFYHCDIAVVITNSIFTNKAKEFARETGILLWDKMKLCQLTGETERKEAEKGMKCDAALGKQNDSTIHTGRLISEDQLEELRHNFAVYLAAHKIPKDSSWYDAFYLYRNCKELNFFELLNMSDFSQFQSLAYEYLMKTLTEKSTAKGTNISCYIRGISLLWKYLHGDETPYIPYQHEENKARKYI